MMKYGFGSFGSCYLATFLVFCFVRPVGDSMTQHILSQAAGALGFTLNPIILIMIIATAFTFKKIKESFCDTQRSAE